MKIKNQLKLERLIAKIDNDFNISESDWIPRVAAWTIDALSQMQVLPMERKRRKLEVSDRIAQFPCCINAKELKVYDKNGCEIPALEKDNSCCSNNRTSYSSDKQIAVIDDANRTGTNFMRVGNLINKALGRNFVLSGNNIELNFDTDEIEVETYETATYHDDYYDCEVPYIYDNGYLLEALAWYVLFKYLSRGSHHPVYDLKSLNTIINPYSRWNELRVKAASSVKIAISNSDDGWNNFFYNSTFLPRY